MMEFRVGSTGAGALVGCGVGVGFVTPVSLHSVPVVGQLASGLAASLGSFDAVLGGLGSAARRHLRSLGFRGLDAGFGCGIMLGYGFGAGFMLQPQALESLTAAAARLKKKVVQRLPPELQRGALPLPAAARGRAAPGGSLEHANGGTADGVPTFTSADTPGYRESGTAASPAPLVGQHQHQAKLHQVDAVELMRLVLKQQNLLEDLTQQVAQLQAAVCRLDSSAPGCNSVK